MDSLVESPPQPSVGRSLEEGRGKPDDGQETDATQGKRGSTEAGGEAVSQTAERSSASMRGVTTRPVRKVWPAS
jgi:hypothetical protein